MEVNEKECKTIMSKSKGGYDFSINPYTGCNHGCVYCYAPYFLYEKREWGSFVDVKTNAPEALERDMKENKKGNILISIVTDPYQSVEKTYKLTRRMLEKLSKNYSVSILTKSTLVVRDIDLFKKLDCNVGMTITTVNEKHAKMFEPNAPSVKDRLNALSYLKISGVKTYIFFGPMLPYISDVDLEKTISRFALAKPDNIMVDRLNTKGMAHWNKLKAFLDQNYPELSGKWQEVLFKDSDYYVDLKKRLLEIFEKHKLKYEFCY